MKIVIIGGGIIGTAHAYEAIKQGHQVIQLERDDVARSASVRNFGLVWVSGRKSGVELQADLTRHGWTTPIIFISGESLPSQIVQAMKQGAGDFLLKPFSMQDLLAAVDQALDKDRATHAVLSKTRAIEKLYGTLTPREREVFEEIIVGKTNKQIATDDGSAAATIKLHRARVLSKMQVDSVADLIALTSEVDISALKSKP